MRLHACMDCRTQNYSRLTFMDVIDALDASEKPTILVFQQKWPPELHAKAGLAGGNMTAAMKAVVHVSVCDIQRSFTRH